MKSNKRITITEKELYAVGQLAKQKDLSLLPPEPELRKIHTFSERFERNMEEILASLDDSPRRSKGSKAVKYALIAAAIIALIMALTMGASALRERMYDLQLTNNVDHAVGVFAEVDMGKGEYLDAAKELTHLYAPTNIPDGYEVTEMSIDKYTYQIIYTNVNQQNIYFYQSVLPGNHYIDTEKAEFTEHVVDNITYSVIDKNEHILLIWMQNGYTFRVFGKLSLNDAITIAESIVVQ